MSRMKIRRSGRLGLFDLAPSNDSKFVKKTVTLHDDMMLAILI